uniref:peptidylprolyl isomerase n=1 Tax=Takifugu rubripes TaxID=31033 RepID=A0A674NGX9_TAKRU
MGIKVQRPRCFFDIGISNVLVGRVVVELFSDFCPKTCENFRCLCTGERGIGKGTQKPLHYKGCLFHRIVKDFMIQGGDFSEGNGRGGESIYGGFFEDESFAVKHNKEYLLSMANRGKDTNGSQFFVTTKPSPHLDGVHVVFGQVISGQEVIQTIENQKTDANSRPYAEVKVLNCGELIPKSKGLFVENIYRRQINFRFDGLELLFTAKKAKKERARETSSSSSSSDSESSSDSSSESEESEKESKKKKKKKTKKQKKKKEKKSPEMKEQEEVVTSTVRPEEIPPIPENRFLMRRSPLFQQSEQDQQTKDERQRERLVVTNLVNVQNTGYQRRLVITRSGRKIKGRGQRWYRTPSRSRSRSRDRFRSSETPPRWRQEIRRQRMRAVTGERWIKGDRGDMNDDKEEEDKGQRRERRSSDTKQDHSAEGKKDKKSRSRRSRSKEDEKESKHKSKKGNKSQSRSKSREKSRRSKSRDKSHKHKSDGRRGRSRSKTQDDKRKEEVETDHSKERNKGPDSDKKHREEAKGRNREKSRSKSQSKEGTSKDGPRSTSMNKDTPTLSKETEEKREKSRERGRERSREKRHSSDRERKRRGTSREKEHRTRSGDRNRARDSQRSRRSRSRSNRRDHSKDRSSHRRDRGSTTQRRRRSSDSDGDKRKRSRRSPDSRRSRGNSTSRDRRSPARPDGTKGKERKRSRSRSSSSSDSD